MQIIDGKALAHRLSEDLKQKIALLDTPLTLAIIQVGDREESNRYIRRKIRFGERIGVAVRLNKFAEDISEEALVEEITRVNGDPSVTGIIVQLPLPPHIDRENTLERIDPRKDVDGLAPYSPFTPATPKGIMTLMREYGIEIKGKRAVVMGRSHLVGKPAAQLLEKAGAIVTVVHSQTPDPQSITREADMLIVAIGKAKYVTKDFVKPGAVIIDVGINMHEEKLVGDVDFEDVKDVASASTPVPGGVGPMTIYSLFENVYLAHR